MLEFCKTPKFINVVTSALPTILRPNSNQVDRQKEEQALKQALEAFAQDLRSLAKAFRTLHDALHALRSEDDARTDPCGHLATVPSATVPSAAPGDADQFTVASWLLLPDDAWKAPLRKLVQLAQYSACGVALAHAKHDGVTTLTTKYIGRAIELVAAFRIPFLAFRTRVVEHPGVKKSYLAHLASPSNTEKMSKSATNALWEVLFDDEARIWVGTADGDDAEDADGDDAEGADGDDADGGAADPLFTCAILTTPANTPVHPGVWLPQVMVASEVGGSLCLAFL